MIFASGARPWLSVTVAGRMAGGSLVAAFSFVYPATKYHNECPADYSILFGKNRPFARSLALTSTNGAFDPRPLAGSSQTEFRKPLR